MEKSMNLILPSDLFFQNQQMGQNLSFLTVIVTSVALMFDYCLWIARPQIRKTRLFLRWHLLFLMKNIIHSAMSACLQWAGNCSSCRGYKSEQDRQENMTVILPTCLISFAYFFPSVHICIFYTSKNIFVSDFPHLILYLYHFCMRIIFNGYILFYHVTVSQFLKPFLCFWTIR